jgi:hypothetical protein
MPTDLITENVKGFASVGAAGVALAQYKRQVSEERYVPLDDNLMVL